MLFKVLRKQEIWSHCQKCRSYSTAWSHRIGSGNVCYIRVYIRQRVIWFHREAWPSPNPSESCVYGLQAVPRGLLKWTKSRFSIMSALISTLALQTMSLECVSRGRRVLFWKIHQHAQSSERSSSNEEIGLWNSAIKILFSRFDSPLLIIKENQFQEEFLKLFA